MDGETQDIKLQSNRNAHCFLKNERGSWQGMAPGVSTIKRSQSRLHITCNDQSGKVRFDDRATMNPWYMGNLLIGGLIGLVVDPLTGAMFKYDDVLSVPPAGTSHSPAANTPASHTPGTIMQRPHPPSHTNHSRQAPHAAPPVTRSGRILPLPYQSQ